MSIEEHIAAVVERHIDDRKSEPITWTEREAAEHMHVSPRWLADERRAGRIEWTEGAKGRVMYTRDQIFRYLETRKRRG